MPVNEFTLLQDAMKYDVEERFIDEPAGTEHIIEKLANMELVFFYDGVYWLSYEGEAYARGELC